MMTRKFAGVVHIYNKEKEAATLEARQIRYHAFGEPEQVLQWEKIALQPPAAGEMLVRMTARPINPSDLIPIRGSYAHRISLPAVPGYEGVGIVKEVGPSVPKELVGRRVLPLRGEGTWQDYVKTSAALAVPVPDEIDDATAAQLYINPLTAWLVCTEVLALKPGDIVLVNAGGSSIGRVFAQLAKLIGFRLIAVTRNRIHTEELLRLGAAHVVHTTEAALHPSVMELTNGRGASAAIDSIGGPEGTELARCLQPGGTYLSIGLLSGVPVDWAAIAHGTRVRATLFHLRHWLARTTAPAWQDTFRRLVSAVADGRLRLPPAAAAYPLAEFREAVRAAERPGRSGKILLTD